MRIGLAGRSETPLNATTPLPAPASGKIATRPVEMDALALNFWYVGVRTSNWMLPPDTPLSGENAGPFGPAVNGGYSAALKLLKLRPPVTVTFQPPRNRNMLVMLSPPSNDDLCPKSS